MTTDAGAEEAHEAMMKVPPGDWQIQHATYCIEAGTYDVCDCWIDEIQRLRAAISRARAAAIEKMKKALEDVDPLKAIADWEDSEDIAYAVKKRMIAALRTLSQQEDGKDAVLD